MLKELCSIQETQVLTKMCMIFSFYQAKGKWTVVLFKVNVIKIPLGMKEGTQKDQHLPQMFKATGLLKMASNHRIMESGSTNSIFYDFNQAFLYYHYFQQFPTFFYNNLCCDNLLTNGNPNTLILPQEQQNHYFAQSPNIIPIQSCRRTQNIIKNKKKKRTDTNYLNKYQKQDRNLNSIVLRNFVNFVNNHPQIIETIKSIISRKNLNITALQYLEMFKTHLPSKQSYVGVCKMKSFIDMENQKNGVKIITLILLRKFIDTDFFTVLISSKKVSKSAREKELKHGKNFWKFFTKQVL